MYNYFLIIAKIRQIYFQRLQILKYLQFDIRYHFDFVLIFKVMHYDFVFIFYVQFRLLYIIYMLYNTCPFIKDKYHIIFHASYNVSMTIIKFSITQTIIQQSKHMSQQQDPFYKQTWDALSPTPNQQYLNESITIQWVNRILAQRDQHHKLASINVQQQLHIFMKDIHSLDRATMKQVMFKFQEAMQFYEWLLQKYGQEVQLQARDQGGQVEESNNRQAENNIDKTQNQQKITEQKIQNQIQKVPQQQQNFLYPSKQKQSRTEQNQFQEQVQKHEQDEQQQQLTNNYREYLLTIFQHYCRMSYATGNDPTFQQIQQKTQVMTINKFMIFCKDFGIVKLNGITRQGLVEIFKKNSEFYKEMNYQQFVTVLVRVAKIVYGAEADQEPKETSKEFQQFLLFLQVNNFSAFKKKIQSLNISYKAKAVTQNIPKKPTLQNYKFKYTSNNGKSEQQVRQQLEERKRIRSENKLKLVEKRPNKNMSSKKDIIKAQHQQRDLVDRAQIKTTQPTRKQLIPPIPPPRKPTNNINRQPAEPVVTGYANIHRLKVLGKQGQVDSKMRLNSVVEQAKKMLQLDRGQQNYEYPASNRVSTYGHETPYSNYSQNRKHSNYQQFDERGMAQSEHSNYSHRDLHHVLDESPVKRRNYAAHGHSQLQKRQVYKGENAELKGLINNDSEQDEFLEEHLNREKKIGHINERIEKKIKQYEIKNLN